MKYPETSALQNSLTFGVAMLVRTAKLGLFVLCLVLLGRAVPAFAEPVRAPHLTVDVLHEEGSLPAGGVLHAGLYFKLDKGWHVYWLNAGDSGLPPTVRWTLPQGVTAGALQFPAPKRLPLGPLMDYGYEDEVLFPVQLQADRSVSIRKPALIGARVDWLVCREVCIPGKATLKFSIPVSAAGTAVPNITDASGTDSGATAEIFKRLGKLPIPLPTEIKAVFAPTASGFGIAVLTGKREERASFFPFQPNQIENAAAQVAIPINKGVLIELKKDEGLKATPQELHGLVVLASGVAYEVHALPGTLPSAPSSTVGLTGLLNVLRIAGLALLGGVILNLMPCVFPVLFIKGLALVQSSGEERSRMRVHGLVYTLGIVASFWVVVAVLLLFRAGGRQLGWGFQFQSPIFVALMALLLFFLGLSLAGQFEIGLTLTSTGSGLANKSGYAGSFFTGVLAMVVATPCTAPFMGAAIGYALAQSAAVTFTIFTALALGLALPYLLLAFNPAWTRLLPRPGAWMEVLKQATAVPVFGTVIWLVWVFTQSAGVNALIGILCGLLLLAVAGWILGRWPAQRVSTVFATVVVAIAVGVPLYAVRAFAAPSEVKASAGDWKVFTPAAVTEARAAGKPVFVDFTASWCLSCQVNERVVLQRDDVKQRLKDSGVVLMKADWTQRDDAIAQTLNSLGRSGVPTYALYPGSPDGAPNVLPEVLTPGILFDALDGLKREKQASTQAAPLH